MPIIAIEVRGLPAHIRGAVARLQSFGRAWAELPVGRESETLRVTVYVQVIR